MEDKAFKQSLSAEPPQLEVLEVQENNEIVCHHCGSSSYKKAGYSRHKKPNYRCQNCKRYFVCNPKHEKLQTTETFDFDSDVWSAEQLGLEAPLYKNERMINFSRIHQSWLKYIAKKLVYHCSVDRTMITLRCYVYYLGTFSDFLLENHYIEQLESITRSTIIGYLLYLNNKFKHPTSKRNRISILKTLFEVGTENTWFCIEPYLFDQKTILSKLNQFLGTSLKK